MELKKVIKGETVTMPGEYCGGKDGWTNTEAPEKGLLIILNAREKSNGGLFVTEKELAKAGYVLKRVK